MHVIYAFVLLLMAQIVAHAAADEIDGWVKSFDGMSLNGLWPSFDLPENTPPEKIVAILAEQEKKSDSTGQFHNYRVIETKKIIQAGSPLRGYTVVLIASDKGSKTMILLNYPATNPALKTRMSDGSEVSGHRLGWEVHFFFITTVP